MWRVRRLDGSISDMVNHVRAKDVAMAIYLADQRAQLSPVEPPPMRQSSVAVSNASVRLRIFAELFGA
jgi:hypothetical protein